MKHVVVVGGGIAGLTTALHLKDRAREVVDGLDVVLLESGDRVGGNIRSDRADGWIIERGPNGYLDNVPATSALVARLGLTGRVRRVHADSAKRYLYRNGRLHLLPTGPASFLTSSVLSFPGRLRVLWEPFARPRPRDVDETVAEFANRRIGAEAAAVLVDAMVSGVFAGDIEQLSLASTFPKMAEMEAEHGGLVRAMLARGRARRVAAKRAAELRAQGKEVEELTRPGGPAGPRGTLTSFDDGIQVLPDRLAQELGRSVRLDAKVIAVEPAKDGGWSIALASGESITAQAIVLAAPAAEAASLVRACSDDLAQSLEMIPSAGLAVVALGYDAGGVGCATDGFGFLVPRAEGLRILGCLWDSNLFPGRAPDGRILMRAMIGGAHDPEAVGLGDDELIAIVREDLGTTMGLYAEPILTRVYRHRTGIAQYTVGHRTRLDRIEATLRGLPGLWVTGSSYYGVSMNACIQKAGEQANEILRMLCDR